MMHIDSLVRLRALVLGGTGAISLAYGLSALMLARPDPFPVWSPTLAGILAAISIVAASRRAGRDQKKQAWDEVYIRDRARAHAIGFWGGLWLYPVFGVLLSQGWVSFPTAFAAMGTGMAVFYLLSVSWLDLKGRAWV